MRQLFNPDGLEPFRDFVPTSDLRRIELCIDQPKLDFPWPYSPDQIRAIFDQTQSARIAEHSEALVSLARRYLGKAWVKIKKGNQKPHVTGELQELAECAHELMSAIDKLSIAAKGHIATAYRMNTPGAPNLLELRYVLDAFLSEHRSLRIDKIGRLAHPFIGPEQERRGRHSSDLERQLIAGLEELFVEAHGQGARKGRGLAEFRPRPARRRLVARADLGMAAPIWVTSRAIHPMSGSGIAGFRRVTPLSRADKDADSRNRAKGWRKFFSAIVDQGSNFRRELPCGLGAWIGHFLYRMTLGTEQGVFGPVVEIHSVGVVHEHLGRRALRQNERVVGAFDVE